MDPIRTAVKYSLIPLRTIVQVGEAFVDSGETPPPPPEPQARPRPRKRSQAAKRTQPAKRARAARSRQASKAPKDLDDVAVARKVETVIFRDPSVPKGKINVNAADGVVWLRGEANSPEQIRALEQACAAIPEVRRVENLLTPHGEELPVDAAREGEGRQPAPLGSNGNPS